jgi:hypothetical protein
MENERESYTREQMVAFLAAWVKKEPSLTLAAAREEGRLRGFAVSRREYEEARRAATGSAIHPEHVGANGLVVPVGPEPTEPPRVETKPVSNEAQAASPPADAAPKPPGVREWVRSYLSSRPDASFAETKAAAVAKGLRTPTSIEYGLARKAAGLGPLPAKPKTVRPARAKVASEPAASATTAKSKGRASAPKSTDPAAPPALDDIFDQLRRIAEERARYFEALKAIKQIVMRQSRFGLDLHDSEEKHCGT